MIGVAHRDNGHTGFFRLFDGCLHGLVPDELPHAVMSFDDRGHRRLEYHLRHRIHFDHP